MVPIGAIAIIVASSTAWPLGGGQPAPACSAARLDDGRKLTIADYRGKVVYLDFWASWCPPCRESFPFMNELQRDFGGKGLQIVAVSVDKSADDARRFAAEHSAQFALALDSTAACPAAYQLPGMPTSFVIDRTGVIRFVHEGFHSDDAAAIRRAVSEALAASRP